MIQLYFPVFIHFYLYFIQVSRILQWKFMKIDLFLIFISGFFMRSNLRFRVYLSDLNYWKVLIIAIS